jgi:hypothetical protein
MEITRRRDGRYQVFIPAKESPTGKRQAKYFKYRTSKDHDSAEKFVARHEAARHEHGNNAVTAEQVRWIKIAETQLGDISRLGEVLEHWRHTGANVKSISATDAVKEFMTWRFASSRLKPETITDTRFRLGKFAEHFGETPLKQIGPDQIDKFLLTRNEGGDRRSFWKRLSPMYTYGSTIKNWVATNPLTKLQPPSWGVPKRGIYTAEQYSKLIAAAEATDEYCLRYLVLMGTGFLRFSELVGSSKTEVVKWEDIQLDRFIHVRKEVAKGTRRIQGDERFIPLEKGGSLYTFLYQQLDLNKLTGRIIPLGKKSLRDRMNTIFKLADVKPVGNGLRHGAISYYLAMFPDVGVSRVSSWSGNSEATCRTHYLQVLRKQEGEDWFAAVDQLIKT